MILHLLAHITPPDLGMLALIALIAGPLSAIWHKLLHWRKGACCKNNGQKPK